MNIRSLILFKGVVLLEVEVGNQFVTRVIDKGTLRGAACSAGKRDCWRSGL